MRPLFSWQRNHVGYSHLIVLFAVTFCCLYGCVVSGGGKAPKDLNERNIAVLILKDPDPYSWREARKAFTSFTAMEAYSLRWALVREVEGLELFEHVTRYEDPLSYHSLKPAYELSMYGAWFARHEQEGIKVKDFVDAPVPEWVAETSKREIVSQRGIMARYELKDRRSGEIVAKWYSFSATSFPRDRDKTEKKRFVLEQTLLEDEHRAILQRIAASVVADNATAAASDEGGSMPPLPVGNSEFVAQVLAESGLLIAGRSSHQLSLELERLAARQGDPRDSPFYAYFGTIDVSYIREQTADLHKSLVSALVEQIGESPMRTYPWRGDYKLAFDIMALDFGSDHESRANRPQAASTAQIGVQLILLSERRVLFEQTPPLIVYVEKSTSGGRQPMAPLCQEAAAKIAQLLENYLAEELRRTR